MSSQETGEEPDVSMVSRERRSVQGVVVSTSLLLGRLGLAIMVALISLEVVARYVFKHSLGGVDEFSGYLLVAVVFLGLASTAGSDAHIRVEIVTTRLQAQRQRWLRVATMVLFLGFCIILTKLSYDFAAYNYVRHLRSSYIWRTPLWIPVSAMPVGFAMLSVVLAARLASLISALRGGRK
ncbi:TRAP transporter small permease subunit [Chloroflexota bacterium]